MKTSKYRNLVFSYLVFVFTFMFLFLGNHFVGAVQYVYKDNEDVTGKYEEIHNDDVVVNFSYSYVVKVNENGGYEGKQVLDNGEVIDADFYASNTSIKIKFNETKGSLFSQHDDVMKIYSYNSYQNDFNVLLESFDNKDGSYELKDKGIYKLVYVCDCKSKVTRIVYFYIGDGFNDFQIAGVSGYNVNSYIFDSFNFVLVLEDQDDLASKYKFYYSFADTEENAKFKDVTSSIQSQIVEKYGNNAVYQINEDNVFSIQLDSMFNGDNKYFFFKVKYDDYYEQTNKINKKYSISDSVQAVIRYTDMDGNALENNNYFKKGDQFKIVLNFNSLVKFDLKYCLTSSNLYCSSVSNLDEFKDSVEIVYEVKESIAEGIDFKLKSTDSSALNVAIPSKDKVKLNYSVNNYGKVYFDCEEPKFKSYTDSFLTTMANAHSVDFVLDDNIGVENLEYYLDYCKTSQGNSCLDSFDDNHVNKGSALNKGSIIEGFLFQIDMNDSFAKFNGEDNIALFMKAIDIAGNVTYKNINGVKLDNIIIPEKNRNNFIDIDERSLYVKTKSEYKLLSVELVLASNTSSIKCVEATNSYLCLDFDYDLNIDATFIFKDIYGNEEHIEQRIKYSNIEEGDFSVGGIDFSAYRDKEYDIYASLINIMNKTNANNNIQLNASAINTLKERLNIPSSAININSKLVMIVGDNKVEIKADIDEGVTIPANNELISYVNNLDEYKSCALRGNTCDLKVYIVYSYEVNEGEQEKIIELKLLDRSYKLETSNYESVIELEYGDKYEGFTYKVFDYLDNEFNITLVTFNKKIVYLDKNGVSNIVSEIDTTKLGTYTIRESAVYDGAESFPLSYMIIVQDTTKPVIKSNLDGNKVTIYTNEDFDDSDWVVVKDNYDGYLEFVREVDPEFSKEKEGTYVFKYYGVDSNGNKSDVLEITVIVQDRMNIITYVIVGSIALVVILVIVLGIIIEKKKMKRIGG